MTDYYKKYRKYKLKFFLQKGAGKILEFVKKGEMDNALIEMKKCEIFDNEDKWENIINYIINKDPSNSIYINQIIELWESCIDNNKYNLLPPIDFKQKIKDKIKSLYEEKKEVNVDKPVDKQLDTNILEHKEENKDKDKDIIVFSGADINNISKQIFNKYGNYNNILVGKIYDYVNYIEKNAQKFKDKVSCDEIADVFNWMYNFIKKNKKIGKFELIRKIKEEFSNKYNDKTKPYTYFSHEQYDKKTKLEEDDIKSFYFEASAFITDKDIPDNLLNVKFIPKRPDAPPSSNNSFKGRRTYTISNNIIDKSQSKQPSKPLSEQQPIPKFVPPHRRQNFIQQ